MPQYNHALLRAFAIIGALGVAGACCMIAPLAAYLKGHADARLARCEAERRAIEPVLAADPAFVDVRIECWPKGNAGVYLWGRVATRDDHRRLMEQARVVLGSAHEDFNMVRVGPAE